MRWGGASIAIALACAGCAKSSTIPIAADTLMITTSAAPLCGSTGAQSVAVRHAAVETIRHGFDRFIITDARYRNDVRVVGHTPVVANTTGSSVAIGNGGYATAYGQSTTTYSGGEPIYGGGHKQGLMVKMFKDGDPAGSNAVSARGTLGPDWKEAVASTSVTCL